MMVELQLARHTPPRGSGVGQPWVGLHAGVNLPGEQLVGREPAGVAARAERAYLSNVCVAKPVRRQVTLAPHLLMCCTAACCFYQQRGVRHMFPPAGVCAAPHWCRCQREPEGGDDMAVRACCSRE